MSIGRRFINVARAELNSLLDYAAKRGGDGDDARFGGASDDDSLAGFSRQELEEELARRRSAHDEVEDAIRGRRGPTEAEAKARPRRSGAATDAKAGRVPGASATESQKIQQAYAALEVPAGANFATVRVAYRNLMRKYHPDHHTSSPAAQRAANEVAQRLTEAYKLLQKRLG